MTWDRWATWLLRERHGGDETAGERMLPALAEVRDKVLDRAGINPGDIALDVGCGDGLLGFGALDRVGDSGTVIFSDVSTDLLDRCRHLAEDLGAAHRCQFVHSGLPELAGIPDESVDVAMTRSVLIYVSDKGTAFRSLHRVIRPGGRLSIFEPINSFGKPTPDNELWGFDVTGLESLAGKVKARYRHYHPEPNPMGDFDERDLLALAKAAGFDELRLDYRASIGHAEQPTSWETLLRSAFNPLVPPLGQILTEALDPDEYTLLTDHLRSRLDARREVIARAYLSARR